LADIGKIVDAVELILSGYKKDFSGKKILVTAGPTYEDIDPVRFIGNRSSGKMGYQIAKAAYLRGADVTLISGPSSENIYPEIKKINIRSAVEMQKAVNKEFIRNDILIMAAAVADFRPEKISHQKLKRNKKPSEIKLTENPDILLSLTMKEKIVVGFALETNDAIKNAKQKLINKKLDMIVLNSPDQKGTGFEFDTNKVTIIKKSGKQVNSSLQSKFQIANKILSELKSIR